MDTRTLIAEAEAAVGITVERTAGGRMYYVCDDEGRDTGYYLSLADLREAIELAGMDDAYSHWCAAVPTRRMSRTALRREQS